MLFETEAKVNSYKSFLILHIIKFINMYWISQRIWEFDLHLQSNFFNPLNYIYKEA